LRTPPSHSPPGREYGYQPRSPPRRRYGGSDRGRVKDQNHGSLLPPRAACPNLKDLE
ncbi:hypothetical protein Tco_1452053, partial [Tanacetum coccineum]